MAGRQFPQASLRGLFEHEKPWYGARAPSLFLLGWYAFFFGVAYAGFHLGRKIPVLGRADRVPWQSFYVFLSLVSFAGIAFSYGYVFAKSPHTFSNAILHHQFNALRYRSLTVLALRPPADASVRGQPLEVPIAIFRALPDGAFHVLRTSSTW